MSSPTPDDIVRLLGLQPHPEGGHFRQTWKAESKHAGRAAGTAIYFLLREGEESRWHRVDQDEIWHWYAGSPLALWIAETGRAVATLRLGPALHDGERPQAIVPAHAWQSARSLGPWTLVGCTVSPGFEFEGFELAPEGWEPG